MKAKKVTCRKCGGRMKKGMALINAVRGMPDFVGSTHVCTLSATGPVYLGLCLKCVKCGHSVAC